MDFPESYQHRLLNTENLFNGKFPIWEHLEKKYLVKFQFITFCSTIWIQKLKWVIPTFQNLPVMHLISIHYLKSVEINEFFILKNSCTFTKEQAQVKRTRKDNNAIVIMKHKMQSNSRPEFLFKSYNLLKVMLFH